MLGGRTAIVIAWHEKMLHEIVLPATKPETEWVRGRALQKMSPQRDHSRLQGMLNSALMQWAEGRGEVGPEWRFRVAPQRNAPSARSRRSLRLQRAPASVELRRTAGAAALPRRRGRDFFHPTIGA